MNGWALTMFVFAALNLACVVANVASGFAFGAAFSGVALGWCLLHGINLAIKGGL